MIQNTESRFGSPLTIILPQYISEHFNRYSLNSVCGMIKQGTFQRFGHHCWFHNQSKYIPECTGDWKDWLVVQLIRNVGRYQRDNQKPQIEEERTIKLPIRNARTMIYKTLHRNLKTKNYRIPQKPGSVPEG